MGNHYISQCRYRFHCLRYLSLFLYLYLNHFFQKKIETSRKRKVKRNERKGKENEFLFG